jgi:hypothetical protein
MDCRVAPCDDRVRLLEVEGGHVGLAEDLFNIGNGIRSGIQDVPSFVGNIFSLDVPGAATDARKIVGDVGDVLKGLEGLGVSLGSIPSTYGGTVGKIADSPILSAAQLTIEGQKALTGSGDPEAGNGFKESAAKLNEAWDTLYNAVPDRISGTELRRSSTRRSTKRTSTDSPKSSTPTKLWPRS